MRTDTQTEPEVYFSTDDVFRELSKSHARHEIVENEMAWVFGQRLDEAGGYIQELEYALWLADPVSFKKVQDEMKNKIKGGL